MNKKFQRWIRDIVGGVVLSSAVPAIAANFSFTGELLVGKQVQFVDFTLAAPAAVSIRTFQYSGGTNGVGQIFPGGGFDPQLHVFNATSGAYIGTSDDIDFANNQLDSQIAGVNFAAGSYRVALTKFNNDPSGLNLSNGFNLNTGDGFSGLTKGWALDISNVTTSTVVAPVGNGNLACAANAILVLPSSTATQAAQLNTMLGLLSTARTSLGTPYSSLATTALKTFLARTNGCGERGSPDTIARGASEMDFVPSCPTQATLQACFAVLAP